MSKEMEAPTRRHIGELISKIDALSGQAKQDFCRSLSKDEKRSYIESQKEKDMERVNCIFRCHEPAGGSVTMTTRPYAGCQETWTFVDGQLYSIPMYLAKRMNSDYQGIGTWYPTHSYLLDGNGKPMIGVGRKNHRFGFISSAYA